LIKRLAAGLLAIVLATMALVALDQALPPDLSRLNTASSTVLDRQGRLLAVRPAPGGVWRFRTTTADIDPAFLTRLIAVEDRHFWHHPGVNPLALARATAQDLRAGRIVSGGSTLTMQVARLLTPRPRTVSAKLIEIARAIQLETRFSKREILGMWLTLAPYGGNLEGVRAGALAWFGVEPNHLDDAQSALLVAIPRRPESLRPDRHPTRARAVRDRLLQADGGDLPTTRQPFPRHAGLALPPLPDATRTTIDLKLQAALEAIIADRGRTLPDHAAVALIVAETSTREIRALASGSATTRVTLDLTHSTRSPGSALKPFIYAMAFEAGQAGPETMLDDLPRRFGGYAPENFDRNFSGRVTMAEALRRSLNMPAVALLAGVGPGQFLARMNATGITLQLPRQAIGVAEPSLPLALGGVGTNLRDMAALYAALAGDGTAAPLRLLCCAPDTTAPRLVSQRAAATIAGILTQPFPDGGPDGIAWKTGTSWGGRDVWSMGFDGRHVAGVWVGRPDGTPLPGATGRALALPLLSRLFTLLPSSPRTPLQPTADAATRVVATRADALRLLFPPPGAVLSGDGPITLRAMGGQRPLVFLVDGSRLQADPARREAAWLPPGAGFYQVTILDALGQSTRSAVRVR
jgi:penicillin-binding protein 1C